MVKALGKCTIFIFFIIIAGCQSNGDGTEESQAVDNVNGAKEDSSNMQETEVDHTESEVESYYDSEYKFENEFVQEDINFAIETNKNRYQEDEDIALSLINRGNEDVRIPDAIDIYTFTDGEVQLLEKEIQHVLHYIEPSDSFTPNYAPDDEIRDYFGEDSDLSGAYILSVEFDYETEGNWNSSEKIGKLIYIE